MSGVMKSITSIFSAAKVPKLKVPSLPDPTGPAAAAALRLAAQKKGLKGQQANVLSKAPLGTAYSGQNLGGTA